MTTPLNGSADGRGRKITIVVARFNSEITDRLLRGAMRGLTTAGVEDANIIVASVPGAVEIPFAAQRLVSRSDAVIVLGAVIRGETSHYDYVCSMVSDGVMRVMLDSGCPIAFGVLTCENEAQALARAGDGDDNKGFECARAALEMTDLWKKIEDLGAPLSLGFRGRK